MKTNTLSLKVKRIRCVVIDWNHGRLYVQYIMVGNNKDDIVSGNKDAVFDSPTPHTEIHEIVVNQFF